MAEFFVAQGVYYPPSVTKYGMTSLWFVLSPNYYYVLTIHYCIQYYYCISVVICLQSVICLCLENCSVSSKKSALFNKVRLVQRSHSRLFFRKLPTLFNEGYVLSYNKTKFIYIPQGFPA